MTHDCPTDISPLCQKWLDDDMTQAIIQADHVDVVWLRSLMLAITKALALRRTQAGPTP